MELIQDDNIDFEAYMAGTNVQQVKSASHYVQALLDQMDSPVQERHTLMPWKKTHNLIQFRPGEVTVWGGENSGGKSLVTGEVALSLSAQGERSAIASFEMKPTGTMLRMGQQWTGYALFDKEVLCNPEERRIARDMYEQFRDWSNGRLWIYDKQGDVEWELIPPVIRYAARELKVGHFFVDNLMKCVADEDDYNGQKRFVNALTAVAREEDIHVHLVHHIKKPDNPSSSWRPNRYSLKGTGAISDQVDNVILVWRNKEKERLKDAGKPVKEFDADTELIVDKQRNGSGWEGVIGLYFDAASRQFVSAHNSSRIRFDDLLSAG